MSDEKPEAEVNHLIAERRAKLERLREHGGAFPNDFRRDATAEQLHLAWGHHPPEWFDGHPVRVTIAGRMMFKRVMGKASFAKLKDRSGRSGRPTMSSKAGTWETSSAPRARCSRRRPASSR
jgi:lysyl-tRNA synthetase, class II